MDRDLPWNHRVTKKIGMNATNAINPSGRSSTSNTTLITTTDSTPEISPSRPCSARSDRVSRSLVNREITRPDV